LLGLGHFQAREFLSENAPKPRDRRSAVLARRLAGAKHMRKTPCKHGTPPVSDVFSALRNQFLCVDMSYPHPPPPLHQIRMERGRRAGSSPVFPSPSVFDGEGA